MRVPDQDNLLSRMNASKKLLGVFYIAAFSFMFLCNVLTLKMADDFAYCYSWADGTRITNPLQIIPSMVAHATRMNGRLVAHGVAQFWLMLPDWIFDVVNSLVFIIQIPLIVRISKEEGEQRNNLLHIDILCAIWLFVPAFGQANLWLDGACNYLWSVPVGLVFILPYVRYYMSEEQDSKNCSQGKNLLLLLSFLMGGWAESGSAAFIFMAVMLLALGKFWQHKRIPFIHVVGIVSAAAGYISMYLAPAQMNKASSMSIMGLLGGVLRCVVRLCDIWILVAAFILLFVLNVCNGTDRKRLVLAGVFFLGAICANFIVAFAAYYPERVLISTVLILICADAILAQALFAQGGYRMAVSSILLLLALAGPVYMLRGAKDIYDTYSPMKANEEYIYQCAENGIMDVKVPIVVPGTKYSALYDLRYMVTDDPYDWPNNAMVKYYGIDSILGIEP